MLVLLMIWIWILTVLYGHDRAVCSYENRDEVDLETEQEGYYDLIQRRLLKSIWVKL